MKQLELEEINSLWETNATSPPPLLLIAVYNLNVILVAKLLYNSKLPFIYPYDAQYDGVNVILTVIKDRTLILFSKDSINQWAISILHGLFVGYSFFYIYNNYF